MMIPNIKEHCKICGKELDLNDNLTALICKECDKEYTDRIRSRINGAQYFVAHCPNITQVYEQGWVCPKCGAVMNPNEKVCVNCKGNTYKLNL